MLTYILVAIVIIVLISLIYWFCLPNQRDKRRRRRAYASMQRSAGVFDNEARIALDELTNIDNPGPQDRFQRGQIIRHNILDGNTTRRNRALDTVVRDFTDTLTDININTDNDHEMNIGREFIIHNIEVFGHDIAQGLRDNDMTDLYVMFFDTIDTRAPAARKEIVEERAARAAAVSDTRLEAANNALDDAVIYTNDAQNVHDSNVNRDLRATLATFKRDIQAIDPAHNIEEARAYINKNSGNLGHEKSQHALQVLDTISKGDLISTYGDTEDAIFAYTWERCKDQRNAENADLMREAIITGLADSIENGHQVCINGRTSHVLNSLATLDYDPALGSAMTFEAYRNQIFQETKQIINDITEGAKASSDAALRAGAESYEMGDESDDVTTFKAQLQTRIDNNIDTYSTKLSQKDLANIKSECHVYAML